MNTVVAQMKRMHAFAERLAFLGPLLVRVTLALVFVESGWGKLKTLNEVTAFFTELKIPLPAVNAVVASTTEFVGGILILVGLGTRFVALPLAFTMVIAIITAKRGDVDGVTALAGLQEFSYLVMFLWLALAGAGRASIDHWLWRRISGDVKNRPAGSDPTVPA